MQIYEELKRTKPDEGTSWDYILGNSNTGIEPCDTKPGAADVRGGFTLSYNGVAIDSSSQTFADLGVPEGGIIVVTASKLHKACLPLWSHCASGAGTRTLLLTVALHPRTPRRPRLQQGRSKPGSPI